MVAAIVYSLLIVRTAQAQSDSTRRSIRDTATVQGSIYSRPFIATSSRVSVGGYVEGNSNYFVEDGLTEGFSMDGARVDDARRVTIAAVDFSLALDRLSVRGELARVAVVLPRGLEEVLATRQQGAHVDVVLPVLRRAMLGLPNATISVALRAEYVDFNVGRFASTGAPIRDDIVALVSGLSLRANANTVFKANYRREKTRDLLGNPATHRGGYQVGFATYV